MGKLLKHRQNGVIMRKIATASTVWEPMIPKCRWSCLRIIKRVLTVPPMHSVAFAKQDLSRAHFQSPLCCRTYPDTCGLRLPRTARSFSSFSGSLTIFPPFQREMKHTMMSVISFITQSPTWIASYWPLSWTTGVVVIRVDSQTQAFRWYTTSPSTTMRRPWFLLAAELWGLRTSWPT